MQKTCENRYKICRVTAGFTQISAAELLHISERSLSDYENGKAKVPDDVVAAMANEYSAPLLAWWHLKETSILGQFLPDIQVPQTHGDMIFQLVLSQDDLAPEVATMKRIMSKGQIGDDRDAFNESISLIKRVSGKLLSVAAYAEQLEKDTSKK